jgi:D-alanine-D-alanine ligase
MDKIMMKNVLANYNIPQVKYAAVTKHEFSSTPEKVLERLENLGFPMFVKPANLGSSVGISKAKNLDELRIALRFAFGFDRRVIVEASTKGKPRELEVAILGNDNPKASPVGELTFESEFYDYETKYTAGRAEMHIPASVPAEISARVQALALEAYQILDCAGLARIDFFYVPESNELFLNELNTIPGFTKTSMYPKLWEAGGLSYAELVSRLVELALEQRD